MSMRLALSRSSARRALACAGLFASFALLVGCGDGGGAASVVTGKVTYNGQPVAGEVVFVGSDKTKAACPITDEGTYTIKSSLKGEVQVLVKGPPPAPAPAGAKKQKQKGEGAGDRAPPAKYATAGKDTIKFNITGGEQVFDIDLK